jgi:hypothetical protein
MKIAAGNIAGVELIGPGDGSFAGAVEELYGRAADAVLRPALPFSVVAINNTERAIALLGVRFDMLNPKARAYSVVHYADTLRYPEKAALQPGAMRFVCAEPLYTEMVLRQAGEMHARGPMNLEALRKALRVRASIDCVAFDDGEFTGADSLGAFERFEVERQAELALVEEMLAAGAAAERIILKAIEAAPATSRDRALLARKFLARRLQEAAQGGGVEATLAGVSRHRVRLKLWRPAV